MVRPADRPSRGLLWLASIVLVLATVRVAFGGAAAVSGSLVGAVSAVVGVVMLVESMGLADAKLWAMRLAIALHGLDGVAAASLPLVARSSAVTAVPVAVVDLLVLGYLVTNHRRFEPVAVSSDPLPTERRGRFEERWDRFR